MYSSCFHVYLKTIYGKNVRFKYYFESRISRVLLVPFDLNKKCRQNVLSFLICVITSMFFFLQVFPSRVFRMIFSKYLHCLQVNNAKLL